ncbi:MAG: hypothetical protein K2O39_06140 [Clostridiales bacterium]|nr:hypothetical protein [Clostridiales bacterium]
MAKKLNTLGIVFFTLVLVGFVLAVVGMCTPIITMTLGNESEAIGLSHEMWDTLSSAKEMMDAFKVDITIPTKTFTVIAFVVALVGAAILAVNAILGLLGKDIKILGLVGAGVTIVGGILILVAGLVLASQFGSFLEDAEKLAAAMGGGATGFPTGASFSAGIGIWIGFIGALLAGVAGLLGALKIGQKA